MYHIVDLVTPSVFAISLICLSCAGCLMMASFTRADNFLDLKLRVPLDQLPTEGSSHEINTRPLVCLICHVIMREWEISGNETARPSSN